LADRRAEDIASQVETIHAHATVGEARSHLRRSDCTHIVAVDDGAVAALLESTQIDAPDASMPWFPKEMVGNLNSIPFCLCRHSDDVAFVKHEIRRLNADAAIVVGPRGEIHGVIFAAGLAGSAETGGPLSGD